MSFTKPQGMKEEMKRGQRMWTIASFFQAVGACFVILLGDIKETQCTSPHPKTEVEMVVLTIGFKSVGEMVLSSCVVRFFR